MLVQGVLGDVLNAVGFPLNRFCRELTRALPGTAGSEVRVGRVMGSDVIGRGRDIWGTGSDVKAGTGSEVSMGMTGCGFMVTGNEVTRTKSDVLSPGFTSVLFLPHRK